MILLSQNEDGQLTYNHIYLHILFLQNANSILQRKDLSIIYCGSHGKSFKICEFQFADH